MSPENQSKDFIELQEDLSSSPLYSEDLAPVPAAKRNWNVWNLAAIWVGMAVCIPTYILASYMIKTGIPWHMALIIIGVANLIITVPMVLNGHAGVKYGIPFPVLGRASFGTNGIHFASIVRALVACGWFGIQTWIGGLAFYEIWHVLVGTTGSSDLDLTKFMYFGLFWLVNVYFIWKGTESIKWLENFAAPILVLMGLILIFWGANSAGGIGIVLEQSTQLEKPVVEFEQLEEGRLMLYMNPLTDVNGQPKATEYYLTMPLVDQKVEGQWSTLEEDDLEMNLKIPRNMIAELMSGEREIHVKFRNHLDPSIPESSVAIATMRSEESTGFGGTIWGYVLWLTAMVGFWATMSLSIADITRYVKTQKEQVVGQFIGLPGTMILYSFVGIFVTCAAVINFKDVLIAPDAPWDPVSLLGKFENPVVVVIAQIFMLIATLSTNIAANVIAPANAFSNLFPKQVSFRQGGIIAAVIGILICPWWLLNEISGILIFVSGLLGPVLGILLADYYWIRNKNLELAELYKTDGVYAYGGSGFNSAAMIALGVGVFVAIIGYFVPALEFLYNLSWFTGFIVSFILYGLLMKKQIGQAQSS